MKLTNCLYTGIAVIALSCSPKLYSSENKVYQKQALLLADTIKRPPVLRPGASDTLILTDHWLGTTNFNLRKPNIVVIHHTAQNSCDQTFNTFRSDKSQVSAHYVICRNGTIQHMLNDYLRAWHAGNSRWGNITDLNSSSIGIELDNNGSEPFSESQIHSLLQLLGYLKKTYNIPTENFIGHADIAPGRKVDPSYYFPWKTLADNGFGYWYNDTTNVQVPADFDHIAALRIIGYNVKDSVAAFEAFRLHFEHKWDSVKTLDSSDNKILYQLYKKYL